MNQFFTTSSHLLLSTPTLTVLFLFLILFLVLLLRFIAKIKRNKRADHLSYLPYQQKYLLTKNEYSFYLVLKQLTDKKNQLICPKVRLADLFDVTDRDNFFKYFGKINRKHVDFLICDSKLAPLFAIELDDKTHEKEERQLSDRFKDALFASSSIGLIRIPASMAYDKETIRKYLY